YCSRFRSLASDCGFSSSTRSATSTRTWKINRSASRSAGAAPLLVRSLREHSKNKSSVASNGPSEIKHRGHDCPRSPGSARFLLLVVIAFHVILEHVNALALHAGERGGVAFRLPGKAEFEADGHSLLHFV